MPDLQSSQSNLTTARSVVFYEAPSSGELTALNLLFQQDFLPPDIRTVVLDSMLIPGDFIRSGDSFGQIVIASTEFVLQSLGVEIIDLDSVHSLRSRGDFSWLSPHVHFCVWGFNVVRASTYSENDVHTSLLKRRFDFEGIIDLILGLPISPRSSV